MAHVFLRNRKVETKFRAFAGLLILLGTALWASGYLALRHTLGEASRILASTSRATRAADQARDAQAQFKGQVQEFKDILLRGHDPQLYAKYHGNFERQEGIVHQTLEGLRTALPDLGMDPGLAGKALKEHEALGAKYRAGLALFQPAVTNSYRTVDESLRGIDRPMGEALGDLAKAIIARGEASRQAGEADLKGLHDRVLTLQVALLVLVVLLGVALSQVLSGQILRSIGTIRAAIARMAARDFSTGVAVETGDEFGQMAEAFNTMMREFRDLLGGLKEASSQVAAGSTGLSTTAGEMARASEEIARFAEGQRIAGERTSAAVMEFSASIREVSGNIKANTRSTEAMVAAVEDGVAQGRETEKAMRAIGESNHLMVEAVKVIQDLARQTNLLSLNAAIEAAKAGAHGRGFSVVAEEVRKLAERSGGAAREIATLIEQAEEAMARGVAAVQLSERTLQSLAQDIHAVASVAREIGTATEEQRHTSDEVARQVEDNALATERSAAASTELAQTVGEVNRTAEGMAEVARALSESVARFKTS